MSPRDMGCFALKRLPLKALLALPLGELSPQAAERASQLFPHIFLPTTLQTPAEYDILISVKNHKLNIGRRSRPCALRGQTEWGANPREWVTVKPSGGLRSG